MFLDEVVISGILIVGLCVVFCAGFGYFVWNLSLTKPAPEDFPISSPSGNEQGQPMRFPLK